jgi:hypothetical protein
VVDLEGWPPPKVAVRRECAWICEDFNGVLVIVGLVHMMLNHGVVLRYVDGPGRKKRVEMFADLGWAPRAFMLESPNSVIVLTRDGFVRVHTSGRVESIFRRVYGLLSPNSFTLSPNGVIHVGMRHFITRLTPSAGTYKEEWFIPANCTQFALQEYDCVCSAALSNRQPDLEARVAGL